MQETPELFLVFDLLLCLLKNIVDFAVNLLPLLCLRNYSWLWLKLVHRGTGYTLIVRRLNWLDD